MREEEADNKSMDQFWSNSTIEMSKLVSYIMIAYLIWCPYWLKDHHFLPPNFSYFLEFLFWNVYFLLYFLGMKG